jgi:ADP-ribose pyrophosphatase YjhB (NUDIX family)
LRVPNRLVRVLAYVWTRWLNDRVRTLIMWVLNAKFAVGVTGIVLDDSGRVLFLEHAFRRRFKWALPGGWIKRGEHPETAIVRELREETGLDVAVERLVAANAFPLPRVDVVYLCRVRGGQIRASGETPRWRWCRAGEAPPEADPYSLALLDQVGAWQTAAA